MSSRRIPRKPLVRLMKDRLLWAIQTRARILTVVYRRGSDDKFILEIIVDGQQLEGPSIDMWPQLLEILRQCSKISKKKNIVGSFEISEKTPPAGVVAETRCEITLFDKKSKQARERDLGIMMKKIDYRSHAAESTQNLQTSK